MVKRMTPVAKAVASYATEPLVRHTKTSASAADGSGDPGVYAGLWPNRDPGAARRRRPPPGAAGRAGRPTRLTGPRRPRAHQQVWAGPPHPLDHAWAPSVCAAVVRHPSLRYAVPSVQPRRGTCGECAQGQPGKCAPERALLLTRCPRNDRAGVAEGSLHGDHRLGGGGQRAGIEVPQIMEPHARLRGRLGGLPPDAGMEGAGPHRAAAAVADQQPAQPPGHQHRAAGQVLVDADRDAVGQRHAADAGLALGCDQPRPLPRCGLQLPTRRCRGRRGSTALGPSWSRTGLDPAAGCTRTSKTSCMVQASCHSRATTRPNSPPQTRPVLHQTAEHATAPTPRLCRSGAVLPGGGG